MKRILLFFQIIVILHLVGCVHYSFYSSANPHLKTVMIADFENDSEQYEISQLVNTYLTEKFISDNRLKVKADKADMEVTGKILSYDKKIFSYDVQENPQEWQITIRFLIEVNDLVKNSTIWNKKNLSLSAVYSESNTTMSESDIANYSEEDACRAITYDLGDMILGNSVEQW